MKTSSEERKTCRISGEPLVKLFTLGDIYISDFIKMDAEPRLQQVELKMMLAPKSGLVQLAHTAPFDEMYEEYWYRSGTNATMTNELRGIAEDVQKLIKPKTGDTWIDIGCNDGTLLSFIDKDLIRVGFDPSRNSYTEESEKHASVIINDYFNNEAYKKSEYGNKKAKVITSIAMFYDLEDPHRFVDDVYNTLDDDGLWVIQMSYLPLMLNQLAFDNICHEHLEYYSLTALKYLLDKHDFKIVDCKLNDINGGSFRIYIRKNGAKTEMFGTAPYRDVADFRVQSILSHEKTLKLDDPQTYFDFYNRVLALKKETMEFIKGEIKKGKKICGYGASTKGNTLLQWFGLTDKHVHSIAERSPAKFKLKTAGTNIPILSEKDVRKKNPDYFLVLPWHFINEFIEREQDFLERGGKFIVPCPKFKVIGK